MLKSTVVSAMLVSAVLAACAPAPSPEVAEATAGQKADQDAGLSWTPLFPQDGEVKDGWIVRHWADVSKPVDRPATWEVRDGILYGVGRLSGGGKGTEHPYSHSTWAGSWLLSEREYDDFILETEFRFQGDGERGNGGIALRAPLRGDPAYDGIELQITDERYERSLYPNADSDEMTGALYLLSAPAKLAYRPGEWNRYRVEARGPRIRVWLNGERVQDVDLSTMTAPARRHGQGTEMLPAAPGKDRPLRGHVGFQDLSDSGETLLFRNARIAELK